MVLLVEKARAVYAVLILHYVYKLLVTPRSDGIIRLEVLLTHRRDEAC